MSPEVPATAQRRKLSDVGAGVGARKGVGRTRSSGSIVGGIGCAIADDAAATLRPMATSLFLVLPPGGTVAREDALRCQDAMVGLRALLEVGRSHSPTGLPRSFQTRRTSAIMERCHILRDSPWYSGEAERSCTRASCHKTKRSPGQPLVGPFSTNVQPTLASVGAMMAGH